jgi:hypothetical protein
MVLHMMSYIYSHCRTEGRWLTGVNLQVRTSTMPKIARMRLLTGGRSG